MHLVPFGYLTKLGVKWAEVVQKVRAMKSCRNFLQQTIRSTPLDSNLMFHCVSYYLGAFGIVCCVTTLSSKPAKLVRKFVPQSRVGIFHNECTRSPPLDSNLMFRCVSYYLGAFGTVCCVTRQCKIGQPGAKVRAMKSRQNFSQRTHPVHPIGL